MAAMGKRSVKVKREEMNMAQREDQTIKTYQVKIGYIHRKVAGADVLISVGGNVANFNGYIQLNPAASFLWDQMKAPATCEELAGKLAETFEIDFEQAREDVLDFLKELEDHDMVEVG